MKLKMSCLFNLKTLLILIITINALICYSSTKKSSIKAFSPKNVNSIFSNKKPVPLKIDESDKQFALYLLTKNKILLDLTLTYKKTSQK